MSEIKEWMDRVLPLNLNPQLLSELFTSLVEFLIMESESGTDVPKGGRDNIDFY